MLDKTNLFIFCCFCIEKIFLSGTDFSTRLCATQAVSIDLFGSLVRSESESESGYLFRSERCRNPGNRSDIHSLSGTPHWCLQDYIKVTLDSNTSFIPSGCSLWVKETEEITTEYIDVANKTGLKKLCEERIRPQHFVGGLIVETKECTGTGEGLNSGRHNLRGNDYWCRQHSLHFPRNHPLLLPSGCSCYVRG